MSEENYLCLPKSKKVAERRRHLTLHISYIYMLLKLVKKWKSLWKHTKSSNLLNHLACFIVLETTECTTIYSHNYAAMCSTNLCNSKCDFHGLLDFLNEVVSISVCMNKKRKMHNAWRWSWPLVDKKKQEINTINTIIQVDSVSKHKTIPIIIINHHHTSIISFPFLNYNTIKSPPQIFIFQFSQLWFNSTDPSVSYFALLNISVESKHN